MVHFRGILPDHPYKPLSFIIQLFRKVFQKKLAIPVYRSQWSPQVMRNRVREGLQLLIGSQ